MRIPFANRTADVDLPAAPGQPKVTVRAVIDSFREQLPSNFSNLFEAFVLLSPRKVRVTCRTPHNLEEVQNLGLTFRSARVTFHPCRTAKWVNVTRLSYGIPNEALQAALSPFGKVLNVKMASYQGVYVGVRNVLMEISTPIPSSLKIAEHWCNVFYPGQIPTCFNCRRNGHTRANCPLTQPEVPAVDATAIADPILLSPARRDLVHELLGSVVERVAAGPASYAQVVVSPGVTKPVPELETAVEGQNLDPDLKIEEVAKRPLSSSLPDSAQKADADKSTHEGVVDSNLPGLPMGHTGMDDNTSATSDSESVESDDDFFDVEPVTELSSLKRSRPPEGSSECSDSSLSPTSKKGKEIQVELLEMCDAHVSTLAAAAALPLPDNVDSDIDLFSDKDSNNPIDPDYVDDNLSTVTDPDTTDYPLTQPTPVRRIGKTLSQSSESLYFTRRSTKPDLRGTGCGARTRSQSHSRSLSDF